MAVNSRDIRRVLVAGVGNIFLGDDAFGVEVAQRLARRPQPAGVIVKDFGIRGLDLAYQLLEGFDLVIIVDAHPRGRAPGTLYVLEPELDSDKSMARGGMLFEGHSMDPIRVFGLVESLGGKLPRLIVVGCEPEPPRETDDFAMTMSEPVRRATEEAISLIETMLERIGQGEFVAEIATSSS